MKVSSQQIELRDESGRGACHGSTQMANDVRNVRTSCCNQIEIGSAKLLILRDELGMFMSVLFLLTYRGLNQIMQIGGIGKAIGL